MELYESEAVEMKEIYTPELKKEILAFANTNGGMIYFLSYKGLKPTGVYVRSGTTSAPASEDAIRMMIRMTDGDSFESNRSLIQELTFTSLNKEMERRNLEFSEIQMKNLGILSTDDIYTNMGLLVSDQCKHSIKFAVFQGNDKLVFKYRKELTGSLFAQLIDAYKTIDFYNGTKATFHELLRTDERDYPEDAIREALLNAIVHRDYSFGGSTIINLYSDRLEIISLGGLVSGLSLEAAMLGASQPRNEKLASLFYRMKLIEAYGAGISKIISCYKGLPVQPKFENVEGAFRVVLPNTHAQELSIEDEKYLPILRLYEKQKEITRSDVEEALGIGTTHAINMLKKMLEKELIRKVGSGRLTRYVMKQEYVIGKINQCNFCEGKEW
jgi:ATP-dependent DNA helicase RecG